MTEFINVFHCPVHGEETNVFCFRAFDENLFHLWKVYKVERTELSGKELAEHKSVLYMKLKKETK